MNLLSELERWLPAEIRPLVDRIGAYADKQGLGCFIVGGPVRDLLLGQSSLDLDIVVEGGAIELAQMVASISGVRPVIHRDFGTATVPVGAFHIDLATARAESYERPGALPNVRAGTIGEDLARRDFSINAMAVPLNGSSRGELLDPHDGRLDLAHGVLRVLHDASFIDDATRVLRGVRYEQRFGFAFEAETSELLVRDQRYLETISGDRVRHEFERTFDEAEPQFALRRLDILGTLRVIDPSLSFSSEQAEALHALARQRVGGESVRSAMWCVLCWGLGADDVGRVAKRLNLPRRILDPVRDCLHLCSVEAQLAAAAIRPSEVVRLLRGHSMASLLASRTLLSRPAARERVVDYLDRLRFVRASVDGDLLISLGFPQGPEVGRALERIREARLDGEVNSRAEEVALARSLLGRQSV
ncbi:MAG: CCA tRNA nucleotidyltransferase [Anaerolineae bacterium]|nr:CCA tRNA nucleotidyltransferase [Anaerolineae bacterium]